MRRSCARPSTAAKDQSYFLFAIEPQVLARTILPLGALCKSEVRDRARAIGLPVAEKAESQEVCFVPKGQYAAFVARAAAAGHRPSAGDIVDETGHVVGRHDGIHQFTIGQRRGLGVQGAAPLYVTDIDAASGTVRVGSHGATIAAGLRAVQPNWLTGRPVPAGERVRVKIRSRFAPAAATLSASGPDGFELWADTGLSAVTPGQAAVLYDGDRVVGGGWIVDALRAA